MLGVPGMLGLTPLTEELCEPGAIGDNEEDETVTIVETTVMRVVLPLGMVLVDTSVDRDSLPGTALEICEAELLEEVPDCDTDEGGMLEDATPDKVLPVPEDEDVEAPLAGGEAEDCVPCVDAETEAGGLSVVALLPNVVFVH